MGLSAGSDVVRMSGDSDQLQLHTRQPDGVAGSSAQGEVMGAHGLGALGLLHTLNVSKLGLGNL